MDRKDLEQRIASFLHWDYRFDFDNGASTPLHNGRMVNRQEQRRRYFFDALLRASGGSLEGRRVLDIGCGPGFWALQAIEAGADFVLGVDAEHNYVEQAKLVFEAKGIDPARYAFEEGNILDRDAPGQFDVVLCLSVMHQVSKPVELFELISGAGAELIVIETELSRASSSYFEVSRPRRSVEHKIALLPTRDAVGELADEFGYTTVPLKVNITDFTGMDDYRRRRRLAFICSKGKPLGMLPAEESWDKPWWAAPQDLVRDLQRRRG